MFLHSVGCNNAGCSGELWVFSTTNKEWTLLSTTTGGVEGPRYRVGHAMTTVGSDIYLHGGDSIGLTDADDGEPTD